MKCWFCHSEPTTTTDVDQARLEAAEAIVEVAKEVMHWSTQLAGRFEPLVEAWELSKMKPKEIQL